MQAPVRRSVAVMFCMSCASCPPILLRGVPADDIAEESPGVMELLKNKSLKTEDPVQFKGYVVSWVACPECPNDIPCEPCEESMLVGDDPEAPTQQTIEVNVADGVVMAEMVTPSHFYLFRAEFGDWSPGGPGAPASVYQARAWPIAD